MSGGGVSGSGVRHPSLRNAPSDLIGGRWVAIPGESLRSHNPARPAETVWAGSSRVGHVDAAVRAAREALPAWAGAERGKRFQVLRRYQEIVKARAQAIAELIADETGKVMWEAKGEAALLAGKVDITLEESEWGGLRRVTDWQTDLGKDKVGRTYYRPHGVMAVLGPFNFPAHLPNGHIVPALAMGNTVVLKPSDKAPAVGQMLGELFQEALEAEGFGGLGVVNVVQGAADVARGLVEHEGVDGILFTGSWPVGRKILESNLDRPGRIVALEMGGNNPAVVMPDADLRQAAIEIARCAFNTAGQRCTCTRRAIIHRDVADRLIPAICKAAASLIIGDPRATHPVFMGPVIRSESRDAVLKFQGGMSHGGGEVLVEATAVDANGQGGWFVSPGVVRVPRFTMGGDEESGRAGGIGGSGRDAGCDVEVFGPLLRVSVADSFEDALEQANAARFGLAASIFTHDEAAIERFFFAARAGCVNVNTGTAGASSKLPFGGLGHSGNHRPAGAYSLDYCAYPVAAMVEKGNAASVAEGMRFEDSWLG